MTKWTNTTLYDFLISEFELIKLRVQDDEEVYKILYSIISVLYERGFITVNQYAEADQFLKECLIYD